MRRGRPVSAPGDAAMDPRDKMTLGLPVVPFDLETAVLSEPLVCTGSHRPAGRPTKSQTTEELREMAIGKKVTDVTRTSNHPNR